jgi:radical SAM protein with 4Fe4S-binding SPASM domain
MMDKIRKLKYYSIPHLVHIEMSYTCNSKCVFCYNPGCEGQIDYDKIDKIIDSVYRSEIPHVYLIGGEPSLLATRKLNEYINLLSRKSSVTIVTNGLIYKRGLSKKLACIGIPLHGDRKTHERLTGVRGGYDRVIETIKKYVKDGFDVRSIPVLMSANYSQMYELIGAAKRLGMESVFVDKFESGGIGSRLFNHLKPSLRQFKVSLTQMIKARDDFKIPVGFGTAIPFCLDERLIRENMWANCGVGVTFGAINPDGDFRICNQSNRVYGNVLRESIETIWNKRSIDDFRCLGWVSGPCKRCVFLETCVCGCKVDLNRSDTYCIDYALMENSKATLSRDKLVNLRDFFVKKQDINIKTNLLPRQMRYFRQSKYLRLNLKHKEKYLITQYQTIEIDSGTVEIIGLITRGASSEEGIIKRFKGRISQNAIRHFLNKIAMAGAIVFIPNKDRGARYV